MKYFRTIFLIMFLCNIANFAYCFNLSGYIENLFSYNESKNTLVNPENILSISKFANLTELQLNLSSKDKKTLIIDTRARYDTETEDFSTHFDQAYINFDASEITKFKMGRQRIGFGVGYLWNPVNNLDLQKDIYNPTKYIEGIDGLKFNLDFTSKIGKPMNLNFEILPPINYSDNSSISYSKFGSQFYIFINEIEIGLVSSYHKTPLNSENILFGSYYSIDIKGIIFGLEYAQSKNNDIIYFTDTGIKNKSTYYPQIVLNMNKRTSEKSFLVLEYFYNGSGYDKNEFENLQNLTKNNYSIYGHTTLSVLNPGYVNRNYIFSTFSNEISDYVSLSISSMLNIDNSGAFIYPQISWTKIKNLTLSLENISNISANKDSEFSIIPYYYILIIRSQYYF
ncbi:MAG TPA: hypothetical protein DCP53_05725 [Elusimicrobia bacterium]|nr:hypothetical protein [Elusimicrobiota bacterium]